MPGRPVPSEAIGDQRRLALATKPFSCGGETILKHLASNHEAGREPVCVCVCLRLPMFELAAVLIASLSVVIFLAHAIEAFRAE